MTEPEIRYEGQKRPYQDQEILRHQRLFRDDQPLDNSYDIHESRFETGAEVLKRVRFSGIKPEDIAL